MTCLKHEAKIREGLRLYHLKATPARLRLLDIFEHASCPLSTAEVAKDMGSETDTSTVYRNLEALLKLGVLQKVSLRERQAYYELADSFSGRPHRHHLTCLSCKQVTDIYDCSIKGPSPASLKKAGFSAVSDHSLEFFGLCLACRKNK